MLKNKLFNPLYKCVVFGILTTTIVCCDGSNSSNSSGPDSDGSSISSREKSDLYVIAPKIINSLSGPVLQPVVIFNNANKTISGVSYTLTDHSLTKVVLDKNSMVKCASITANSSCVIMLNVPANTQSGAVQLNVAIKGKLVNSTIPQSLANDSFLQSPIISIEPGEYNNTLTGASAVITHNYHKVIAGVPYVIVSGFIASDQIGEFNNIVITDNHDNVLPQQRLLSGNLGANATNLAKGDTFSILLPAPASAGKTQSIRIQVQLVDSNGHVLKKQTSTNSDTIVTESSTGIINVIPSKIQLNNSHSTQLVNIVNSGSSALQIKSLSIDNPNFTLNFKPTNLLSGQMATATVSLNNDGSNKISSGNLLLTANNGKSDIAVTSIVTGNNDGVISKTKVNLKSAGSTMAMSYNLTNDNNLFATAGVSNVIHRSLVLTNSSFNPGTFFIIPGSSGFSISNVTNTTNPSYTIPGCVVNNDGTITMPAAQIIYNPAYYQYQCDVYPNSYPCYIVQWQLQVNAECSFDVAYTIENGSLPIGQSITQTASSVFDVSSGNMLLNIPMNIDITPSTANLNFDSSTYNMASTYLLSEGQLQQNSQLVTITNTGDGPFQNGEMQISSTNITDGSRPAMNENAIYFGFSHVINDPLALFNPLLRFDLAAGGSIQTFLNFGLSYGGNNPTSGDKSSYLVLTGDEPLNPLQPGNTYTFPSAKINAMVNPITIGSSGSTIMVD